MKRTKKLPKKIFVYWDGDDDPQFFECVRDPAWNYGRDCCRNLRIGNHQNPNRH